MFRVSEAGSLMKSVVITVLTCQHLVSYLHFTCHLHIIKIYTRLLHTSPRTGLVSGDCSFIGKTELYAVVVCTFAKSQEDQSN